jgi:hypothetical protein
LYNFIDFIGLVAALMDKNFNRNIFVVDVLRMPGNSHNAENIKEAIETMVNLILLLILKLNLLNNSRLMTLI